MASRAVPITSFAASNGMGRNVSEILGRLEAGQDGFSRCPLDVPFETVCGVIDAVPFDELPEPHPSRLVRVALACFEELAPAVSRAARRWGGDRVALVLATSTGGIYETELAYDRHKREGRLPPSYRFEKTHSFSEFADEIRRRAGLSGPRTVVSTACSSSAKAFGTARRMLDADLADAVIVGGVDTLCFTTVRGFHSLGVLAPSPCRPFAAERPGMNIGEGAAFILLEREGDARAWFLGIGESSDAFHMSAPHPDGDGAELAMRAALTDAGLEPAAIDHVNAHGTGTAANDVAEARAIERLLGAKVPVVSTKSYTGHTLGAGGATEAVLALLSIEHGFIPASLRASPVDPNVKVDIVTEPRTATVERVMSNSFAFGGNNASVILGRTA
jgi:3-oxoacyl-[acyl-carrier-protein] synthase-1